jgi:hypothetical protein
MYPRLQSLESSRDGLSITTEEVPHQVLLCLGHLAKHQNADIIGSPLYIVSPRTSRLQGDSVSQPAGKLHAHCQQTKVLFGQQMIKVGTHELAIADAVPYQFFHRKRRQRVFQGLERQQVVLRRVGAAAPVVWPDGFGTPAEYNLLTFKAIKDPLSAFAMKELVGHSVSYRKLVSPDLDQLLPEEHFRMVAVSMQFPSGLAEQIALQPRGPGAYDVLWGTDTIRVLVLREMPEAEQNLVWNLFSSDRQRIAGAFQRLQPRLQTWSSLLNDLLEHYGLEGMAMPYTMQDYEREVEEKVLRKLTPEQLLARLTPEQLLARLSPEQRLEGMSPEQLLSRLPREEIEKYLQKHKARQAQDNPSSEPPETRP